MTSSYRSRGKLDRAVDGTERVRDTSNSRTANSKLCRFFLQSRCTYGVKCKFSHEASPVDESMVVDTSTITQPRKSYEKDETLLQRQIRENYNIWKRSLKFAPDESSQHRTRTVWRDALRILDNEDQESKQKLAQTLVDPDLYGLQNVKYLMEMSIKDWDAMVLSSLKDFLLVITHRDLLHCLAIDTFIGTLYSFISGSGGNRIITFLGRLHTVLTQLDTTWYSEDRNVVIKAMSTLLRWVLRKELRARFHEDLQLCLEQLESLAATLVINGKDQDTMIREILEMRAIASKAYIVIADTEKDNEPGESQASAYPKHISRPGGRHDNDYADIGNIAIFPTASEIRCDQPEYLPFADRDLPHHLTDCVARHIDTQFRLLRHDTFVELKDALGRLHYAKQHEPGARNISHFDLGDIKANQYKNAWIQHVSFDVRHGLEFHISFPQSNIAALQRLSKPEKAAWWEDSKLLSEGILISFVTINSSNIEHLFFTIVRRELRSENDEKDWRKGRSITIIARLASLTEAYVKTALTLSYMRTSGLMIEFPSIVPATFKPILENLQMMQRDNRLPFQEWILPDHVANNQAPILTVAAPLYARKAGFTFSLKSILKKGEPELTIDSNTELNQSNAEAIEAITELDYGQCEALIAALTREFAFIQGPPGTGKSYLGVQLMRILLDHKKQADLGPIIIVCYTNHALDQFLEHLLKDDIQKIIRIGGQSKSELLERHNLREVCRAEGRFGSEKYYLAMAYKQLETAETDFSHNIGMLQGAFSKQASWQHLGKYLTRQHPQLTSQFRDVDADGFRIVGKHPFDVWSKSGYGKEKLPEISVDALLQKAEVDATTLSKGERIALLEFWRQDMQDQISNTIFETVNNANTASRNLDNIHDEVRRRVLSNCDVIGVTTTGLAKNISLLQHIQAKVIICEEAGEVMEPHMICALLPSVEHFIQIGDHQQLRPQINTYALSMESDIGQQYQLDRSQFERLSVGEPNRLKIPLVQLNQQRRMPPQISLLIRKTMYPELMDHPNTLEKGDVVGMRSNLFWLDHSHHEAGHDESGQHYKSHTNEHEIALVHALVRHVVRQGVYSSSEIAVLTPYAGQLSKLRTALRKDFEIVVSDRDLDILEQSGFTDSLEVRLKVEPEKTRTPGSGSIAKKNLIDLLRIATVDNFQGEEAKVVIVSLVRSNREKKVGFLRTPNRINVLLSRAKNGMYLIGNAETYSNVKMWQQILDTLKVNNNIGQSLGLCCPRHKEFPIEVTEPEDFARLSPEGGCQLACQWRLECGHRCQSRCHSEKMHKIVNCSEPCQRLHEPCKHACQKVTCGEPCGQCEIIIQDVELPCGHYQEVFCYQVRDVTKIRCKALVLRKIPGCSHIVQLHCSVNVANADFKCLHDCTEVLECGHQCPGKCGECRTISIDGQPVFKHKQCSTVCKRPFGSCQHLCQNLCHQGKDCGLCRSPCQVRCQHSKCELLCHESCAPCIEACTWYCRHRGTCTMPCGAPCDRLPCDERCEKILSCGHRCPSICGEDCPEDYCQQCGKKSDARVDLLEMKTYAEIDPNTEPIIVLGCGHFFTIETLDGMIGMQNIYTTDATGKFDGLQDISRDLVSVAPRCPDCNCPLEQYFVKRYGRLVNRSVVNGMTKRFIIYGQAGLSRLSISISSLAEDLQNSQAKFKQRIRSVKPSRAATTNPDFLASKRHSPAYGLGQAIERFIVKVEDQNQPTQKIYEAIVHTLHRSRQISIHTQLEDFHLENKRALGPARPIVLGARLLQARYKQVLLQDQYFIYDTVKNSSTVVKDSTVSVSEPETSFFEDCQSLIKDCVNANLPRLAAQTTLCFAEAAHAYCISIQRPDNKNKVTQITTTGQDLLAEALLLCTKRFSGFEQLAAGIQLMQQRLNAGPRYETVTAAEIAMIKEAMLEGRNSLSSHSGHWYNCVNGHPFAIGECGMPMELARCPECGAAIGGQSHRAVDGVSTARQMED